MTRDVPLTFRSVQPFRETLYTAQARLELIGIVGCWTAIPLVLVGAVACAGRRPPGRVGWILMIQILAIGTAVVGCLVLVLWVAPAAPRTDLFTGGKTSVRDIYEAPTLALLARDAVRNGMLTEETRLEDVLPTLAAIPPGHPGIYTNIYTGKPVQLEPTPGNLSMRTIDGRKYLCLYGADALEYRMPLPPASHPELRTGSAPSPQPTTARVIQ
jgi:hypothetical protein